MKLKVQERAQLRSLPVPELQAQLRDCEDKLFKLRFANAVAPLKNGIEIQGLRRHRARLLTWINLKQKGTLK